MDHTSSNREALAAELIRYRRIVSDLEAELESFTTPGPEDDVPNQMAERPEPPASRIGGQSGAIYTQDQLMAILDSMPSGVEIVDATDGRLSFLNQRGRELHSGDVFGMDNNTHLEMSRKFKMDGSPFPIEELPVSRSLRNGETVHDVEMIVQQQDGQRMAFLVSAAPLRDTQGRIVAAVASFLDITRRKAIENALNDALQTAEMRTLELDAIINSVPDSLLIYNTEERPVFTNEAARQLSERFKFQVDDDIAHKAVNSFTEDGRPIEPDTAPLRRALRHGETTKDFVIRNSPAQKPAVFLSMSCAPIRNGKGVITGAIALLRDITQSRAIESALRESEKKYREIVKYAPAGIYEIDYRSQRFTAVNDAMCEITGYSRAELLEMDPMTLMNEEGRRQFRKRVQQYLNGETPETSLDYVIKTKDGREIDAALVTTFTTDVSGQPVGATVIAIDITERKKLEEALRRKADELAEADRNKTLFLHTLSHELRNPLATIVLGLDLLDRIADGNEQTTRTVHRLMRQASHLTHLVDDLLDLTRITTNKIQLKKQSVDLIELLRRSIADHQQQFNEKRIALTAELPDEPVILQVDPVRLQQGVGNLLHNALKFTPAGGLVQLSASRDPGAHAWLITVSDNGSGIDPDVLPKLFQPFSQADQSLARDHGGLGLGLSIVKGIVELHGGTIEGYSEGCGKGARFTIHLPE